MGGCGWGTERKTRAYLLVRLSELSVVRVASEVNVKGSRSQSHETKRIFRSPTFGNRGCASRPICQQVSYRKGEGSVIVIALPALQESVECLGT